MKYINTVLLVCAGSAAITSSFAAPVVGADSTPAGKSESTTMQVNVINNNISTLTLLACSAYARSLDEVTTLPTRDFDFDPNLLVRGYLDEELTTRDFNHVRRDDGLAADAQLDRRMFGWIDRTVAQVGNHLVKGRIKDKQEELAKDQAVVGGGTTPPGGSQASTPPPPSDPNAGGGP